MVLRARGAQKQSRLAMNEIEGSTRGGGSVHTSATDSTWNDGAMREDTRPRRRVDNTRSGSSTISTVAAGHEVFIPPEDEEPSSEIPRSQPHYPDPRRVRQPRDLDHHQSRSSHPRSGQREGVRQGHGRHPPAEIERETRQARTWIWEELRDLIREAEMVCRLMGWRRPGQRPRPQPPRPPQSGRDPRDPRTRGCGQNQQGQTMRWT